MYDPAVLRFVLISGLVGFAVFCISSAVLVWRRRQASARRSAGSGGTLRRIGTSLLVAGLLCFGVAVAVREVNRVEGMLSSEGLYAIRASDDDYQVTYLLESTSVSQGTVIARFESPEAEAQVQELQLQCQRLIKQRAALQLEPLGLDNELVRHHQNAITAVNQLRASVGQLLPEHESVVRQATMERLSRQEKIARLVVDISTSEGQLVQTRAHRAYLARELERAKRLNERSAVAQSEVDAWQKQLQDSDTSIENLQRQLQGLQDEKAQLQQSLAEIASLASQQRETLSAELQKSRLDCGEQQSQQQQLNDKLTQDVQRASRLRQHELEQLDLQVQECQAQLAGLNKTLTIQAPYDGTVVYRDPSPRSAQQLQPIFVLARQPGFRLEAMLPRRYVTPLDQADRITIELLHPAVERYFSGSYLRCRPLPERPGYVVAELACQPPELAIRQLLEGEQIEARLAWRPPLLALPLVRASALMGLIGLVMWLAGRLKLGWQRAASRHDERHSPSLPVPALELPTGGLEAGSVSALHELLGERLREGVLRGEIDTDLLAAIEWALDRHHVRAVRQMRAGLHWDGVLAQRVTQLQREWEHTGNSSSGKPDRNGHLRAEDRDRILRVLRTIDAAPLPAGA